MSSAVPVLRRRVATGPRTVKRRISSARSSDCCPERFRRRGVVLGISGGIDSSAAAALCVKALGKQRVLGLLMPERDSSDDTFTLSRIIVEHLGIAAVHEDITPILEAVGCTSGVTPPSIQ